MHKTAKPKTQSHRPTLQTTTVRLPKRLYDEARSAIADGRAAVGSLNELLIESLSERLKQLQRSQIDADFAAMKLDEQYQRQSQLLGEQFAASDWETLRSTGKGKR